MISPPPPPNRARNYAAASGEIRNLRRENGIVREAAEPLIDHAPARERFAFIHALRDQFGAKLLCRVLVSDGANYRARVRAEHKRPDRAYDDERLTELITEIHTAYPAYGAERITRELKRHGVDVGRRRVARLMRANAIVEITRRKHRNEPDQAEPARRRSPTWSGTSSPRRCPA